MSATVEHTITIEVIECAGCGMPFGITTRFQKDRRNDHQTFYCPSGHPNVYRGKTDADKLRDELETMKNRLQWATDRAQGEERRHEATKRQLAARKGQVTKLKKRASAGICPCCNRHFTALERHMATKHPDFVGEDE